MVEAAGRIPRPHRPERGGRPRRPLPPSRSGTIPPGPASEGGRQRMIFTTGDQRVRVGVGRGGYRAALRAPRRRGGGDRSRRRRRPPHDQDQPADRRKCRSWRGHRPGRGGARAIGHLRYPVASTTARGDRKPRPSTSSRLPPIPRARSTRPRHPAGTAAAYRLDAVGDAQHRHGDGNVARPVTSPPRGPRRCGALGLQAVGEFPCPGHRQVARAEKPASMPTA